LAVCGVWQAVGPRFVQLITAVQQDGIERQVGGELGDEGARSFRIGGAFHGGDALTDFPIRGGADGGDDGGGGPLALVEKALQVVDEFGVAGELQLCGRGHGRTLPRALGIVEVFLRCLRRGVSGAVK